MPSDTTQLIKERLDIAEFIKNYVRLTPAGKNLKGLCPFHKEKTPSFMVSPERQSWHCFGCFPPGQKVKTPFGYHDIETIDTNHFVYSGAGKIRKVLATQQHIYEGDLIEVVVRKLGGIVSLTADHKLKVLRPKTTYAKKVKQFYRLCRNFVKAGMGNIDHAIERYGTIVKVQAGELQKDDFVFYPISTKVSELKRLDLKDYLTKTSRLGPKVKPIPYTQDITAGFLKLLGYWIAEGSNHRGYIRFSLGNHEEEFAKEIVDLIGDLFGLSASIYRRKTVKKTGLEITACHSYLANIFENLCGKGAVSKHIPFIFQELLPAQQMVILQAIFKGDGCEFRDNKTDTSRKSITTVSRVLAEQIVDILLRNNIFPSLTVHPPKESKEGVHHKEWYQASWIATRKSRYNFTYQDSQGTLSWLLPVRRVSRRKYNGPVYNFTVEKDHSYIATNFAVANCNTGGDVISFLMQYENLEFFEALKVLAEKAGVDLRRFGGQDQRQFSVLYDVNRAAQEFFKNTLNSNIEAPRVAREYLKDRGLNQETIEEFGLGFAPNSSDALSKYLMKIGFAVSDIERAGFIVKTERGTYWDRFRNRIMFPLANSFGKVIGFTGRIMPGSEAEGVGKYVNSPDSPLFNKSKLLYGFDRSKNFIREHKSAVLVEGQMDFLMTWQDGVKNLVATSGTALTADHLIPLRRVAETLTIGFDNDEAGQAATERVIDLAAAADFSVNIINKRSAPSELKDPADIAKHSPGLMSRLIAEAYPAMNYYFDRYLGVASQDVAAMKRNVRMVLAKVKAVSSPIEQSHWLRELSGKTHISEAHLLEELETIKREARAADKPVGVAQEARPLGRHERIAEQLLTLALSHSDWQNDIKAIEPYLPPDHRVFFEAHLLKTRPLPAELQGLADMLIFRSGLETIEPAEEARALFDNLIRQLTIEHRKAERQAIAERIKQAEVSGDSAALAEALREFDSITREINTI